MGNIQKGVYIKLPITGKIFVYDFTNRRKSINFTLKDA